MALTISISGTAEEIIAYGKVLEKGMRPKRMPSQKKAQLKLENEYLRAVVKGNKINAIKLCRENSREDQPTSRLKEAKDYIEALIAKGLEDGRLVSNRAEYPTYEFAPGFKP